MEPAFLAVAFALGYVIYRLGLPPLVGFLLAGLALKALGYTTTPILQIASDVGVTLLLFTIGLKLKVKDLFKPEVWGGACVHMALTVAVMGFVLFCLGYSGLRFFMHMDPGKALLLSFALSFSSTVFAVKILDESGRMNSLNGRTAIGVLIIQDLVAVVYLTVSTGKLPSIWAVLVIMLLPLARMVFLRMLNHVGHGELITLFGLFLALVAGAHAFEIVHLKPDLGALMIGMVMAPHPRAQEMANALMSVKDLLLVGFFLNVGLIGMPDASGLIAALALVVLLPLKMLLYFLVFTRFTLKARTSFITTINLASFSEFGLIVCSLAVSQGRFDQQWLVVIGIALSVSYIIASPLNRYADNIFEKLRPALVRLETRRRHPEEVPFKERPFDVVIFGMGRVGVGAYDWFKHHVGAAVLGLDFDCDAVARNREQGREMLHADVTDPGFWRRLPRMEKSVKLVVLAMNNLDAMLCAIKMLKQYGIKGDVAAVAQYDDEVTALREAGVSTAFNVYGEAGAGLASHVMETLDTFDTLPLPKKPASR